MSNTAHRVVVPEHDPVSITCLLQVTACLPRSYETSLARPVTAGLLTSYTTRQQHHLLENLADCRSACPKEMDTGQSKFAVHAAAREGKSKLLYIEPAMVESILLIIRSHRS